MLIGKAIPRRVRSFGWLARSEAVRTFERLRPHSSRDRLMVFDPALFGFHGHHLQLARLIKAELSKTFDVRFYAHLKASSRIIAELPAQPICQHSIYTGLEVFNDANEEQRASLAASLSKIDLNLLTPRTVFVMHTLTVFQLSGLAEWFTGLPPAHRPKLFLQFQFPLEFGVKRSSDWPAAFELAHKATNSLEQAGKVIFATNTDLLQDKLSQQLGQTFKLMPLPVLWPDDYVNDVLPGSGIVFGFYGGLRMEKGSRILSDAVLPFMDRHPDTKFIVQAPHLETDEIALRQLSINPRIEIIRTKFKTRNEYFSQLCRSHFILLPYDPCDYAGRTSTIFIEALGLGRPVITTDATWMAHQLRQRPTAAGLIMQSYSAAALYDCLEAAREAVMTGSWDFEFDRKIISDNSASAFCAALVEAVSD